MASIKLSLRKEADPSRVPKYLQELDNQIAADDELERNPFSLYDTEPGWQRVSVEIQKVCDRCAIDISNIALKYDKYGAADTASREAIQDYMTNALQMAL